MIINICFVIMVVIFLINMLYLIVYPLLRYGEILAIEMDAMFVVIFSLDIIAIFAITYLTLQL